MLEVELDGVTAERRTAARQELELFFGPSFGSTVDVDLRVIIPTDFDQTVIRINEQKRGFAAPYSAKRTEVIAVGKTIPFLEDGKLSFIVVLSPPAFGGWEDQQRAWRCLVYSHEAVHVLDEISLFQAHGANRFFREPTNSREAFFEFAHSVYMEYRAEKWSLETFISVLKETNPNATITFGGHDAYVESFVSALRAIPSFVRENVASFRAWQMTMEEFWPKMSSRFRELVVLAAFTSAHADALSTVHDSLLQIRGDTSFEFFFDTWRIIEERLRQVGSTSADYNEQRILEIAELLKSFFERCGISVTDTNKGVYVSVELRDLGE